MNIRSIFQRQEELKGWNQTIISELKCLVLGVGGLGTNISMDLARLGVKEIILLDYDTVDYHNLNRQILYNQSHVGKYKVDCAKEVLEQSHINNRIYKHENSDSIECSISQNNTIVNTFNIDAIKNWSTVIELIKNCNIVYNTIDYGDYFDVAVSLACIKFNKLMILGGTEPFYGHTISYFLQGLRDSDPKYLDNHDLSLKNVICQIQNALENEDNDLSFIPKDVHPEKGGSTVYSAGTCSHLMVASTINYILALNDNDRCFPKHTIIMNLIDMSFVGW